MPVYTYKCIGCGAEVDLTSFWDARPGSVQCPDCGSDAFYIPTFNCSVGPTHKQWSGRKEVNFFTDTRDEIAKKQVALYVNSGRLDKYVERSKVGSAVKRRLEKGLECVIKAAPPIKVDV